MPPSHRRRHCRRCGFETYQFRDALDYPRGRLGVLTPLVWLVNAIAFPWFCPECQARDRLR